MRLRLLVGFLFAALLLFNPNEALSAARQAIGVWATSFLPALLPFFVVTPALSSDEAARLYARLFGRAFGRLFGCPGPLSGAALIGIIAGSPAGAIAAARLRGSSTDAEVARGALLASGVSPGFLINAVGAAMLGDPAAGAMLFRAQFLALITGGLILRRAFGSGPSTPAAAPTGPRRGDAFSLAASSMLNVCAHMVVFAVAAHLITSFLPPDFEAWVLSLMEVSGGCAAVAAEALPLGLRLVLMAFFSGFGGLAIMAQNLSRLPGVKPRWYLGGKLLHGALCALFTWAQLGVNLPALIVPDAWQGPVVASSLMVVLTALGVYLSRRAWYNAGKQQKG
jgi:hypothetical protein